MSRAGGHRDEHLGPLATDRDDLARGRRLVNEIVNGSFVPLAQVRLETAATGEQHTTVGDRRCSACMSRLQPA